jgi:predicted dienelactone hydrolase
MYTSRLNGVRLLPQWTPLSWVTASIAFEDARVAEGDDGFPAIIFSHGNGNNGFDHAYMLEALASYGYVVAAPDHLNNTQDDVRIDFVNDLARRTVIPCLDGLPSPCSRTNVPKSMIDRFNDVEAVLTNLPTWFGRRVDMERVGIMGHSRGTVTSLSLAGGSTAWGFAKEEKIKAVMGLSIGARQITLGVDLQKVTVPTLLVGGTLDKTGPLAVSQTAIDMITTPPSDKQLVVIEDAVHRHFDSAYCAQMQSSGAIAQAPNSAAVLDSQTLSQILHNPNAPLSGDAKDFCGFDAFTTPTDITPLVKTITGSDIKLLNSHGLIPTHGLTTDMVKDKVIGLAVAFFGRVLNRTDGDDRPFSDCLPEEFKNQLSIAECHCCSFLATLGRRFAIAPVRLDLHGRNRARIGLGSYLVNAAGAATTAIRTRATRQAAIPSWASQRSSTRTTTLLAVASLVRSFLATSRRKLLRASPPGSLSSSSRK